MFNRNKNYKSMNGGEYKDSTEANKINNASVLCKKYIHDIRNMKSLDKEMINNIRNMSNEEKMNIIISLNDILEYMKDLI